jgi:hypothetical protein
MAASVARDAAPTADGAVLSSSSSARSSRNHTPAWTEPPGRQTRPVVSPWKVHRSSAATCSPAGTGLISRPAARANLTSGSGWRRQPCSVQLVMSDSLHISTVPRPGSAAHTGQARRPGGSGTQGSHLGARCRRVSPGHRTTERSCTYRDLLRHSCGCPTSLLARDDLDLDWDPPARSWPLSASAPASGRSSWRL